MLEEVTHQTIEWIRVLPPGGIYLTFFLLAYFENIVPPIPGDVLVAFAGYLAAESVVGILPVFLLTTIASVIGFMSLYALGRRWGDQIEDPHKLMWMTRFISLDYIRKARRWMRRWGPRVIMANRFLAGTRSVISLAAGISQIAMSKTIFSATISSILWNAILLGFGWFVHSNWAVIGYYLSIYGQFILGLIAIVLLIRVATPYYRKKTTVL